MSFLANSQRGFDPLVHSDLAALAMNPLAAFDAVSSPQLPSAPQPAQNGTNVSPTSDRSPNTLPRVGQTRCYWSLLSPDLHFLYLDPVLASHLQEQAESLVGKSLLDFVHPDEQASAKHDLGSVLESRTLHGSVTRVRYSRLSRVRRQLGYTGPDEAWTGAEKIAVDANYMAVDIVINWAAEGLVLCFMHAVVDLTPRDNDEHDRTEWTNWCGTPSMTEEQVQLLYNRLTNGVPNPHAMNRVFQILHNEPERSLYMSWPPEPAGQGQGQGPTSKDFARLAEDVQIGGASSSGTDAKTSCTRRYKALQTMHFGADGTREVESIFIPHGTIIFACHKINGNPKDGVNGNTAYNPALGQQYYEQQHFHSYSIPPVPAPPHYNSGYLPPPHPASQYSHGWGPNPDSNAQPQYNQWTSQNTPISSSPSVSSVRSSYPAPHQQQHQWSSQPPAGYMESGGTTYSFPPPPQVMAYGGGPPPMHAGPPSPDSDVVPASRVTQRRAAGSTREQYGNGGRSSGNPPVGISRCSSCKVTHSPEWRKGPSGKKDLCNACGLRYARSRAKKEGGTQRRRKDRALSVMAASKHDHSPSGSPVNPPYSGVRRGSGYEDAPFVSNGSAGSGSGSEAYPQPGMEAGTPSPSPPANGSFIPYSHNPPHNSHQNSHGDRPQFGGQGNVFYTIPPPPPNAALHHMQSNPPPRLEPVMSYTNRMSPVISPVSPEASSPLSHGLSAASFEREKQHEKDHDRAPVTSSPLATEARLAASKSSYLAQ